MKKRSCLTKTDLGSSTVLKRTESDSCWKKNKKPSEIHPFKGDQEAHDNCLNVYQQLTRSYSWLKQNVFHSPDAESIVISNKKIKHVLKEFNNKNFVVQRLTMADNTEPGKEEGKETENMDQPEDPTPVQPEESKPAEADTGEPVEESKPDEDNKPADTGEPPDAGKPEDAGKTKTTGDEEKKSKLSEADERAKNMAKFIEEMKAALAEYAKKEDMTEEDAKEMLKKQEELMAKLSEFEELTKNIQSMAGIDNISSGLLGPPTQCREVNPCGPTRFDNFPKVICFDRISQHELGVPNMIVCEPVCKEKKNPCGDMKQQGVMGYPTPENMKKGFAPHDCDAERYIQKDLSRELHSTEVIGMLDRQGMLGQQYPNMARPNAPPMMQTQHHVYPAMFRPQMAAPQSGMMMQQQARPGGFNHPWAVPGQEAWTAVQQPGMTGQQPGMMGQQPGMMGQQPGMMGQQPGMMGQQPGMMGQQPGMTGPMQPGMGAPMGMLGAQGQMTMMGPKPLPATVNPQGQLNAMNPQVQPGLYPTTDLQASPRIMQANNMPPPTAVDLQAPLEVYKAKDDTELPLTSEADGKPDLTVKQQELISTQTTTRISNGNQFITEHGEIDKTRERSIEAIDKEKPDAERIISKKQKAKTDDMLDGLKKQVEILQAEMKGIKAENRDLQKRVLMCSPDATRQMLRCRTDVPVICRKTLATTPVCKLDLYRQLNLPLPSPLGIKPTVRPCNGGTYPQPQLQLPYQQSPFPGKCRREVANKIVCRRNILKQFGTFGEEGATRDMETMVTSMEEEVKVLQAELNSVQEERRQLEMQKKLLTCTAPAIAGKGVNT